MLLCPKLALPIAICAMGETVSHLAKEKTLFADLVNRFYCHINGALSC